MWGGVGGGILMADVTRALLQIRNPPIEITRIPILPTSPKHLVCKSGCAPPLQKCACALKPIRNHAQQRRYTYQKSDPLRWLLPAALSIEASSDYHHHLGMCVFFSKRIILRNTPILLDALVIRNRDIPMRDSDREFPLFPKNVTTFDVGGILF